MGDVIAAISTPLAPAGLGVIRVSGDGATILSDKVFRPIRGGKSLQKAPGYTALYGHVFDADGDIDECVALVFRTPHSYTGEDVVELSCHGGLYVLQRTLRSLIQAGAVPAGPGEFTKRAFTNGKIDLTRAEAVMQLISANGRLAAKTALAAREGAIYHKLESVKEELLGAAANLTAFVDYPDDDIPELSQPRLEEILYHADEALDTLLSTFDTGRMIREGIDTVIVGKPNVGKSTLMNLLAGCDRSIVTPIAGTTRDIVEETVRLDDVVLRLADTAGIRKTTDVVESIGVERAQSRMQKAALVLAVFDGSQPLTEDDRELIQSVDRSTTIALINKADLDRGMDEGYIRTQFDHVVVLSANNGQGLQELKKKVMQVTGLSQLDTTQPIIASERQRDCACRCLECIREAKNALQDGMTLDAVGVSIDGAIAALLELTGERTTEAVVNEVFSRFCVGK